MGFTLTDILLFGNAKIEDSGTLRILRNQMLEWGAIGRIVEVVVSGIPPLVLPDAIADSLSYVKAFGGTEQRNLPDNYIERQFIYMMDGSYLLPSITPEPDWHIEMDFQTTSVSTQTRNYFGSRYANAPTGAGIRLSHTGSSYIVLYGFDTTNPYTGSGTSYKIENNTRYKYVYNNNSASLSKGGTVVESTTFTVNDTTTREVAINNYSSSDTWGTETEGIYLYSFKAWNGQGELVMDLVPAVQKGTVPVVGFYDTVSKTFMTATSGTFAAGGEAVPTPDAPMDIVSNNGVLKARHQSGLPLGYTAVEYLQNGSSSCAINTGIAPTNTTRVEMKWSVSDTSSIYIFGSRPGGNTQVFTLSGSQSGGTVTAYANGYYKVANTDGVNWNRTSGIDNIFNSYFALNNGEAEYAVDDLVNDQHCDEFFTYTPWVSDIDTPLHLFSNGYNSQPGGAKIWYCKIYNGETLLMDLVPVIRSSDNVGGFYDKVGGGFYTTEQGGTYTGTPITDPVEIYTDGTVETIEDTIGNTATAEMLLKVGDYQDVQSIIDGVVTRKVGVKVFDGTENWTKYTYSTYISYRTNISDVITTGAAGRPVLCTHYKYAYAAYTLPNLGIMCFDSDSSGLLYFRSELATVDDWKQFLADQYAAGTPVIVVYPLATPTTESVAGQTLQVTDGDNIVEITQASMSGLELEVTYLKGA